jgi:hypothetical protein
MVNANHLKIIGHHFSDIWKINKPGYCLSVRIFYLRPCGKRLDRFLVKEATSVNRKRPAPRDKRI